jgi:putative SOS response-associated peptidase YedK
MDMQLRHHHHHAELICGKLHNRVPVVLKPDAWPIWLGEEPADLPQLNQCSPPTLPREWFAGRSDRTGSAVRRTLLRVG